MKRDLECAAVPKADRSDSSPVFTVIAKVDLSALCPLWFRLRAGYR